MTDLRKAAEDALEQPQDALRRWANTDDGPPKTAWQGGYDAARRWVREVGLPALAEPTITQDKARAAINKAEDK